MSSRQHGLLRRSALSVFGPRGGPASGAPPAPRLLKFRAPEIVFGSGSLAEAGTAAERLGARRPFVVADPGLLATGWVDELLAHTDLHDVEEHFLAAL
jgi:hypothetical protein